MFSIKERSSRQKINMCSGPLLPAIIAFAVPLMLGSILQVFYNAADMIVIGQFSGQNSTAAIGATSSLLSLLVQSFIGFSVGVNVLAALHIGAGDDHNLHTTVQTSVYSGALLGVLLAAIGIALTKPLLLMTACPEDVLDGAILYMRWYFVGVPGAMVYNFGTAILRGKGDSRRPLIILAVSGLANVLLNLLLVLVFHLDVAGVAIATSLANYISAGMTLYDLAKEKDACRFSFRCWDVSLRKMGQILRIGVPVAIQNSLYSISNVQIQSAINTYDAAAIAGNAAAISLEGFPAAANGAFGNAAITFVGQNIGAKQYSRIKKIIFASSLASSVFCETLSMGLYLFRHALLNIYLPGNEAAIAYGEMRMSYIFTIYFVAGLTSIAVSALRALGYSMLPMLVSVFGICGLRLIWMTVIYPHFMTMRSILLCYPVTWIIVLIGQWVCLFFAHRSFLKKRKDCNEPL